MALEGLRFILEKEAVLPTPTVQRLLDAPAVVEQSYLGHVRSYVPLGRASGSAGEQVSVRDYEKRLIEKVRSGSAPVGYLAAEYGYGKTSTAAFLWSSCHEAGLLAVPPFQIEKLSHLITAAYAWTHYELSRRRPSAMPELEALYGRYIHRSIEKDAHGDAQRIAWLQSLQREGRYIIDLTAADYVSFFEQLTDLIVRSGYAGLVVIADELQQYMDPMIKRGDPDPLNPLFQLIQALLTRRGHLRCGIILSMPTKELGLMNDQRGDLVQRLKDSGLALDLNTVYDAQFALRLWDRLARQFEFASEAPLVVTEEALRGLGEIAARADLGSGPRTVVDGFKVIIERYLQAADSGQRVAPYTPIDLVDSFLVGQVKFDGMSKLQKVVNAVLASSAVSGQPTRQQAVKLLAAFPSEGAERELQARYGVEEAVDALAVEQLTINVRGGRDEVGNLRPLGTTLRGLEPPSREGGNWLTSAISDFLRKYYHDASDKALERAANGVRALLRKRIFKEGDWMVQDEAAASETRDAVLLLEGSFQAMTRRYPRRRLFVRLLREGQLRGREVQPDVDLVLDLDLARHFDLDEAQRSSLPGSRADLGPRHLRFALNLSHRSGEHIYADLQNYLQPVVSPWKVTPLLLLNLYAYFNELRAAHQIPKAEDPFIESNFQSALLDHALDELFNPELGGGRAGGARIIEDAIRAAIEAAYPEYHTLMGRARYTTDLRDYMTALERLDNAFERQGEEPVERASKDEVASLFNRSNVMLDSFVASYPTLLKVEREWRAKQAGSVRFVLHPQEQRIMRSLRSSQGVAPSGRRQIELAALYADARALGYRDEESEGLLKLLEARGLALVQGEMLVEQPQQGINIAELRDQVTSHLAAVAVLLRGFPDDQQLQTQHKNLTARLHQLNGSLRPDERQLVDIARTLKAYGNHLQAIRQDKRKTLQREVRLLRPPTLLPANRRRVLETRYDGELLASQVEPLRELAQRQVSETVTALSTYTQTFDVLQHALSSEQIDDAALIQATTTRDNLSSVQDRLRQQAERADRLAQGYIDAEAVLREAQGLRAEIQAEGSAGAPLTTQLNEWLRRVQERLSVARLDAFLEAVDWRSDLQQVRQALFEQRQTAQAAFDRLQGEYRAVLTQQFKAPASLLNPIAYNPTDSAASRQQLEQAVSLAWQNVAGQRAKLLHNWLDDVQHMQAAGDLGLGHAARVTMQERLASLSRDLQAVRTDLLRVSEAGLQCLPRGPEALASMASDLTGLDGRLAQAKRQLDGVKRELGEIGLNADERAFYAKLMALDRRNGDEGGYTDLADVLLSLEQGGVKSQQSWQMLQALYQKLRLRVKVKVVDE